MEDVCGALLGASLMLGLKFGRGREELNDRKKLDSSCLPVGKLYKWFEKEFGSVRCREVRTRFAGVYYNIEVPWQRDLAMESGALKKCDELIGKTAARTAEMLWDE